MNKIFSFTKTKEKKHFSLAKKTMIPEWSLSYRQPLFFFPKKNQQKTVVVVGLGYVGFPLACLVYKRFGQVIGIDLDSKKISKIIQKKSPFYDPTSAEILSNALHFYATTSFEAIEQADIVVICVPTPVTEQHLPDLEPLKQACYSTAQHLRKGTLIVIESSIYPGTTRDILQPIFEQESKLSSEKGEFFLAHCPERINPGDKNWYTENIPRVVGGINEQSTKQAKAFYQTLLSHVSIKELSTVEEAEAVKMVENAFRDVNIAFVNELAIAFEKLHINILHVLQGASSKPFSFLAHYPGCGVGGHCIPVDPYYLIAQAQRYHVTLRLLSTARSINNDMPAYTVQLVHQVLKRLYKDPQTTRLAVLGLAYKADVDDERESPSHHIIHLLEQTHCQTIVYDPYIFSHPLCVSSLEEAVSQADILVLATDHEEFRKTLTPEYLQAHQILAVIDGRNCLAKELIEQVGIVYAGIGQ